MEREKIIFGLREFADFLENNPEIPTPNMFESGSVLTWHSLTKNQVADIARYAARNGIAVSKEYNDNIFQLRIGDKDGLRFGTLLMRDQVCRQVETGETEEVEVVDYSLAPRRKETRKVTEWICDEPLLKPED